MSTGTVAPFQPNQPTLTVSATSSSIASGFTATDAIMVTNGGTATAFGAIGPSVAATTATTSTGFPILSGTTVLIGTGSSTSAFAAICAGSGTATVYVTPGTGTQH